MNLDKHHAVTIPCAIAAAGWLMGILIFPLYKNMPIGYIPVAVGVALAAALILSKASVVSYINRQSGSFVHKHALPVFILAGAALRLIWLAWPAELISDHLYYLQGAGQILDGQGLGGNPEYPPGPFYFVAIALSLFGDSLNSVVLLDIVMFAGTMILTGFYLKDEKISLRVAVLLLLALYPSLVIYAGCTGYENQLLFLVMLMLVLARQIPKSLQGPPHIKYSLILLLGIAFGIAALTHPPYIAGPFILGAALYFSGTRILPALGLALAVLLVTLAVIAPWTLRNYSVYNKFCLISANGGVVLLSANNPQSDGIYSPTDALYPYKAGEDRIDYDKRMARLALKHIYDDPGRFAAYCIKRIAYMWGTDTSGIEFVIKSGPMKKAASITAQVFWVLTLCFAALFLFAMLKAKEISADILFAMILILYKFLLHAFFEPLSRHHLEIIPLLLIFACKGFCRLAQAGENQPVRSNDA